ncbi:hypothetical protein IMCC13023_03170 [Candidatus Aquiluna sp. IMCC13023]|nr:hypothetical protein IMCC13023_03170 [Candidatus Aquiluna sp. IMCC13023]
MLTLAFLFTQKIRAQPGSGIDVNLIGISASILVIRVVSEL